MRFNFDHAFSYNTTQGGTVSPGTFDFYTVALHEALHTLGFASSFRVTSGMLGSMFSGSIFGGFSRWDGLMHFDNGQNTLVNSGTTPFSAYNLMMNTIGSANDYFRSCLDINNIDLTGPDLQVTPNNYPVFTGSTFTDGSSFHHLCTACDGGSTPSYVMHPGIAMNVSTALTTHEMNILAAMGYTLTSVANSCTVAGNNDVGIGGCTQVPYHLEFCSGNTPNLMIDVADLIANDVNTTGIIDFELVNPAQGSLVANVSGLFTFTPASLGSILLRYRPTNNTCGIIGNETFVTIQVTQCPGDCSFVGTFISPPQPNWLTDVNTCNSLCNPGLYVAGNPSQGSWLLRESNGDIEVPGWHPATGTPDVALGFSDIGLKTHSVHSGGIYGDESTYQIIEPTLSAGNYILGINGSRTILNPNLCTQVNDVMFGVSLVSDLVVNVEQFGTQASIINPVTNILNNTTYSGEIQNVLSLTLNQSQNDIDNAYRNNLLSCFEITSNTKADALWIYTIGLGLPNVSTPVCNFDYRLHNVEIVQDDFTAGLDPSPVVCGTPVSLGGQDFCMVSGITVEYTWHEINTSNPSLLTYKVHISRTGVQTITHNGNTVSSIPQLTVSPSQTTTYVLQRTVFRTATLEQAQTGFDFCPATDEVTVSVYSPGLDAGFSTNNACLTVNFVPNSNAVNLTHSWDFGDGTTSILPSPSHTYANAGSYTVNHTVCNGQCCVTQQQTVNTVSSCCGINTANYIRLGSGAVVPMPSLQTAINASVLPAGQLANANVFITGLFTIDATSNNYVFNSCNVIMGEGAEIVVLTGKNFHIINNSTLKHCERFWKSVTVQKGAFLKTSNATLEGGEFAVRLESGSAFVSTGTNFLRCYRGIYMADNPNITGQAILQFSVTENVFGRGVGAWPLAYSGQPSLTQVEQFRAGIELNDVVSSIWVGDNLQTNSNLFENLNIGILLRACANVRVSNTKINQIKSVGISSIGSGQTSNLVVQGFGNLPTSTPMFNFSTPSLSAAIVADNTNLEAYEIKIVNYYDGIYYRNSQKCYGRIENNRLAVLNRGISYVNNPYPKSALNHICKGNTIAVSGVNGAGIYCDGSRFLPIESNTITVGAVNAQGIYINNSAGVTVSYNAISLNTPNCKYGINLNASTKAKLNCNDVDYTPSSTPASPGTIAFRIANNTVLGSGGPTVECNASDDTYAGFRFEGSNLGGVFQGNNVGDHFYGLWHSSGVVATQDNRNNRWLGSYGSWGAYGVQASPSLFGFKVNPTNAQSLPTNYLFGGTTGASWFSTLTTQPLFTCPLTCSPVPLPMMGDDSLSLQEEFFIENNPDLGIYSEEINWATDKVLVEKLQNFEGLVPLTTVEEAFLLENTDEPIGKLAALEKSIKTDLAINSADENTLSALKDDFDALQAEIDLKGLQISQSTDSIYTLNLSSERDSLYTAMQIIVSDINVLLASIKSTKEYTALQLDIQNGTINASLLYELNDKLANEIYLATIAKENYTLSENQIQTLEGIVYQCPLLGGPGVYKARSLYALYLQEVYFDEDACSSVGVQMRQTNNQDTLATSLEVTIRPNPAHDFIELAFTGKLDSHTALELFNAQGALVLSKSINPAPLQRVDVSGLAAGLYLARVADAGGNTLIISKLNIVR
jgi:PKD repeat protein/ABC-type transporter Mla MlaB component